LSFKTLLTYLVTSL